MTKITDQEQLIIEAGNLARVANHVSELAREIVAAGHIAPAHFADLARRMGGVGHHTEAIANLLRDMRGDPGAFAPAEPDDETLDLYPLDTPVSLSADKVTINA